MPWNVPDNQNSSPQGKKNPSVPPDLDEMLKKLLKKCQSYWRSEKLDGLSEGENKGGSGKVIYPFLAVLLSLWFLFGIFIVQPAERAVILRWGRYVETVGPGPHWIPYFIESQRKVNEQKISTYYYDSEMLTLDENIVSVAVAVQYRVVDARAYLFNVVNPTLSLQQATASALRQVIGNTTLDDVLTSGREEVRSKVQIQLEKILDFYKTGILVTDVALQPAKAPEAVKAAFDDAIKAQEDEQRYINQAQAYERKVIPIAEGEGQRVLSAAHAYEQQIALKAQGEVRRFLAILPEYKKAPEVTRKRLYLEAMEHMVSHSSKVLVDLDKSHQLVYLPLDKLLSNRSTGKTLLNVPLSKESYSEGEGSPHSNESPATLNTDSFTKRYGSRSMRGETQ